MKAKRSEPRYADIWLPAVIAGLLAIGLSVWGATHQGSDEEAGGSPSASAAPSQSPSAAPADPSGSPSGEPVVDARTRLRAALASWQEADTGAFTQTSVIPGIGRVSLTGVYRLSTRSSEVTQVFTGEDEEAVEIRFLGTQGDTYLNSPDWGPELRPCWMRIEARTLAESTGISIVNGADSLPANVVALSGARALRADPTDPEIVVGTVRLGDAVPLFGSGLVNALRDVALDAPVPAEFRLVDDEIAGWRVSGRSLAAALGSEQALAEPSGVLLAAVASYDAVVEYDELGAAVPDVRPPAPGLRMTPAQARSGAGCPTAQ
ncbi:MAG: hypothetical protein Q7J48_07950 [Nocardioides sp.]|nr:hypothetical protein [Nocardioides sp.]